MDAFIEPPRKIPFYLRLGIWVSRKVTGKDMLPARLLAWYPKAAIGSGVLESLVAHHDREIDERILKIVRMQASFAAACPFCIDMNSFEYENYEISNDELMVLQGRRELDTVTSFTEREKLAIQYARLVSQTPLTLQVLILACLVVHLMLQLTFINVQILLWFLLPIAQNEPE